MAPLSQVAENIILNIKDDSQWMNQIVVIITESFPTYDYYYHSKLLPIDFFVMFIKHCTIYVCPMSTHYCRKMRTLYALYGLIFWITWDPFAIFVRLSIVQWYAHPLICQLFKYLFIQNCSLPINYYYRLSNVQCPAVQF